MTRIWVWTVGVLALGTVMLSAQESKEPKYPHVNLAISYEHDPKWPQKPADLQWAAMSSIAVDAKDNVYLLTRTSAPVQVYDAKGKFLRSWGKGMVTPHQIRLDQAGNLWVADAGTHVVEKYTPDGKLLMTIGTKGKAGRDQTHLNMPTDVAIGAFYDVYISDGYGNARVVHYDPEGKYLGEWGEPGQGPGQFSIPHSIALDSQGRVYVADRNNVRIQGFDGKGKFLSQWRDVLVPWTFTMLTGDQLWVCGSSPMQWRKEDSSLGCPPKDQVFMRFDTSGKLQQLFTLPKGIDGLERPGEVNWVHGMAFDSQGNLYLGDIIGKRAQKFVLRLPCRSKSAFPPLVGPACRREPECPGERRQAGLPFGSRAKLRRPRMSRLAISLLAVLFVAGAPTLPETPKKAVTEDYHGTQVTDEYRWLEKTDDPAVRNWIEAQNRYARAALDKSPALKPVRERLAQLYADPGPGYSVLQARGGRLFARKRESGKEQPCIVVLDSADDPGSARVVVDPNAIDAKGKTAIEFYTPSPDGKLVAVALSRNGTEEGTLHIYDVATGKPRPERLPRISLPTGGGCIAWDADGAGFCYTRYPRGVERPKEDLDFYQQIYHHRLGDPLERDEYVLGKDFPRIAEIFLDRSDDGRWLLATVQKGDGREFEHYLMGIDGKVTQLTRYADDVDAVAFGRGQDTSLYILSSCARTSSAAARSCG